MTNRDTANPGQGTAGRTERTRTAKSAASPNQKEKQDEAELHPSVPKDALAAMAADDDYDTMQEENGKADEGGRSSNTTPTRSRTKMATDRELSPSRIAKNQLDKTTEGIKQAFKSIEQFSSKTNRQMNQALQRPVDSLHSIGTAVKRKKQKDLTNTRDGYTSLPATSRSMGTGTSNQGTVTTDYGDGSHYYQEKRYFNYGHDTRVEDLIPPDSTTTKGGPTMLYDSFFLTDTYIFWAIIFSVLILQIFDHWEDMLQNRFTFGTVFAAMFLAFAIGLEIEQEMFLADFKLWILGFEMCAHEEATWENSDTQYIDYDNRLGTREGTASRRPKRRPFFRRIFNRRALKNLSKSKQLKAFTSLNSRISSISHHMSRNADKATNNEAFMKSLARFNKQKSAAKSKISQRQEKPVDDLDESTLTHDSAMSDISMGQTSLSEVQAADLLEELPAPLCPLRGLDMFHTEDPDPDMITHPFLLENGLRDFPTFFINILTAFGDILVYWKLPDWVKDFDKSLIEKEDDSPEVIALKRFLKGDEAYKTKRFKIMPELVDGPLPVRLLAPHNRAFPLDFEGYMSTTYTSEPPTDEYCPVMCLTLDLITNSTIRGLVGIFKRNMHTMTVDFACIISSEEDDDPSCILGLWRMDHLAVDDYPHLPDRYSAEEEDPAQADSVRGSILIRRISDACPQLQEPTLEVVAETALELNLRKLASHVAL